MPFLNPDHRPQIKHPTGRAVDVIVSIKPAGDIKPLFFRIVDDREERFTFELSYYYLMSAHNFIEKYACEYIAYGHKNAIILLFDVTRLSWSIG